MHSHAELLALRQQLVGRTVVSQRLFLYTLQLYLDRADAGGPPIEADVEVVIDRLEDGVAYVESWAVVEQRL